MEYNKQSIYQRSLLIVIISQVFGGLGLAAGVTVGALIAQDLLGTDAFSGIPSALFTLGSALAAVVIGNITSKKGRRGGLASGFIIGGIGALGVILATTSRNIIFLFVSLFIYGFGSATNMQARYAGTDLAEEHKQSSAISMAMVSTTIGAILGPNLSGILGDFALSLNLPELTGTFILSFIAYSIAGIIILIFLRPDPYIVAQELASKQAITTKEDGIDRNKVTLGTIIMAVTQTIMVAIMTMTPIFMQSSASSINAIGFVIGIHIASMYLPSLFTGKITERIGAINMAYLSLITLIAAALFTMLSPADALTPITIGLSLLGLGWNFGLISGTTLIVESTPLSKRASIQGKTDVVIALGGSFGGAISGYIVSQSGFSGLSLVGIIISAVLALYIYINNK